MARSRTGLDEASASLFGRAVRWATGPAPELGDAERAARDGRGRAAGCATPSAA